MTYFRIQQELERWVEHFTARKPHPIGFSPGGWEPDVDIYETPEEVIVQIEIVGMKQEDIEVIATSNSLLLRGERRDTNPERKKHYHQMEIHWGPFQRELLLPAEVNPEETRATYQDGLLEVVLPKRRASKSLSVKLKNT